MVKKQQQPSKNNNKKGKEKASHPIVPSAHSSVAPASASSSSVTSKIEAIVRSTKVLRVAVTPLPVLPTLVENQPLSINVYRGPTEYSNWVIPGILLVGGFPRRSSNVTDILGSGVDTVLCLVESFEMQRINPNYEDIIAQKSKNRAQLITFPIRDCSVAPDEEVSLLIDHMVHLIQNCGKRLFVHCVGGHGRGGTVVCLLMAKLYQINDPHLVMNYCQAFHDTRVKGTDRRSPQVPDQRNQIYRLVTKWFPPQE